tara:strand:- start:826 stop:1689 length:864 start_codon:yes stop_codon:yes gene_type:complete
MIDVNKKILWISDFDIETAPGGAQRSDKIIIDEGRLQGKNIKKVKFDSLPSADDFFDFDLVISSNVTYIAHKTPDFIDLLSKHPNHVRLEHDSNEHMSPENRNKIFSNCKKTFFLSDYHYSFFKKLYGDIFKNVVINYDPIDTSQFFDQKKEREDKILYAGYMHEQKGSNLFFERALREPDNNFVVAGFTTHLVYHFLASQVPNVEFLGKIEYEEMPEIYNRYKTLFYEPNLREPFCRTTAEACLCGMRIQTNQKNKIGSLQEIEKTGLKEFANKCNDAAKTFWEKI